MPLLFSVSALLISVLSFIYLRSLLKRRTAQERILSEIREEVNRILKTIDETTERDISLVEERERSLKALLDEIDRRLKLYIREMEQRKSADESYAALTEKKSAKPESVSPEKGAEAYLELGKNRYRLGGQPEEEAAQEPEAPGSSFPLPRFRVKNPGASEAVVSPEEPVPVGEQIRSLIRAGFSVPVVASRLGLSIAEVEFATALLERRDAQ